MSETTLPLRLGSPAEFAALRGHLERANFSEAEVCTRLGIDSFASFGSISPGTKLSETLDTAADAFFQLFLDTKTIPRPALENLIGEEAVTLLESLDLIARDTADPPNCTATVGLIPMRGLYLASDVGGELEKLPSDVVFPPLLENTQQFLNLIPPEPCARFLDLGAGSGVAALLAARNFAGHAWAADIAARSVHFSAFNALLNGIPNVTACCGDLYQAVAGLQFDRIVTHPPYVPVFQSTHIFRDGGDDGELILRRAVEGLPEVLAPGGQFYALTLVSDREGGLAEDRIRGWLGESQAEFDIVMVPDSVREPHDFVGRAMRKGTHRAQELQYWASIFKAVKVVFLVYGCILIQRHAEPREPFTVRLTKGRGTGPVETRWALEWNTLARGAGWMDFILRSQPSRSPYLHLAVLHHMQDGVLVPREFMLRVLHPFEVECKCPAWVVALIELCDGKASGQELLESLQEHQVVGRETEADQFAEVLRMLIGSGFLEIAESPVPRSDGTVRT